MQLGAADIDGVNEPRAARDEHLGESAGRRANVKADPLARVEAEMIERGRELDAAARHPRMRRLCM